MLIETLRQDIAYAFRVFVKNPAFTAAVIVSLGLGIGANTAIFSLMDAVMWRMLPVKDPAGLLVAARQQGPNRAAGFTYNQYRALRDDNPAAELAAYAVAPVNASINNNPEPTLQSHLVSGNYFSLLGVSPFIGRAIGSEDDVLPNGHPVAMLSYGYWQRRFGGEPAVLGSTIHLSGMPFSIVGITPPEFFGVEIGAAPDLFLPIMMQPTVMPAFENLLQNPIVQRTWVQAIARLKPGVSSSQAESVLTSQLPRNPAPPGVPAVAPLKVVLNPAASLSELRRQFSRPLLVLMALVGVVLLIACANTANLQLARAAARQPEFAMRLAIGAGRGRLMRQLLVESVSLAVLAGAFGVLLAHWATRLLVLHISSGRTPIQLDLTPNLRILVYTATISMVTGIVFGLVPAFRAARLDLTPALKHVGRSLTRAHGGLRPGKLLAVSQVALSLMLLVGAGLFVRTLRNLNGEEAGISRERILVTRVEPKGSDQRNIPGTTARLDQTYRGLLEQVRRIPGVRLAGMAQTLPTGGPATAGASVTAASGESIRTPMLMVYPDYFGLLGIPLVLGRDFNDSDLREDARTVCIVNEAFVRAVFPGENPLGKPCFAGRRPRVLDTAEPRYGTEVENYEIIGVAKDSRFTNPNDETQPAIFTTFLQTGTGRGQMVLYVRVTGNPDTMIPRIREEVAKLDATLPMFDIHTLAEEMAAALTQQRLIALLSSLFGGLALLLAAVGLYGLLAFGVVQRTGEMGIRIALGAGRANVLWLVMREALMLVTFGIIVGIPLALAVTHLASSQISGLLFKVNTTDSVSITVAVGILLAVAAIAAYLPARRASLVNPLKALRSE
jgi:predicted permease